MDLGNWLGGFSGSWPNKVSPTQPSTHGALGAVLPRSTISKAARCPTSVNRYSAPSRLQWWPSAGMTCVWANWRREMLSAGASGAVGAVAASSPPPPPQAVNTAETSAPATQELTDLNCILLTQTSGLASCFSAGLVVSPKPPKRKQLHRCCRVNRAGPRATASQRLASAAAVSTPAGA